LSDVFDLSGAIIDSVPQLLVRNLDARLVAALKVRAARHGRSAEAEHREILERALLGPSADDFKAFLRALPELPRVRVSRSRDRGRRVAL
jgi:antitoxin FitA